MRGSLLEALRDRRSRAPTLGEPRETIDVDLTLLTGFGGEAEDIDSLLAHFEPRIPDAAAFALQHRVLLLRSDAGVGLDVALGALPFEAPAVERSSPFTFPGGASIRTCSAEDLIILKAFASRPRDWIDIEGVIIRQSGRVDWDYVDEQLAPLAALKEDPRIVPELRRCRDEFER